MKTDNANFRKLILAASMFFCGFLVALILASPSERENPLLADLDDLDVAALEMRLENIEYRIDALGARLPVPKLEALVDARNAVANRLEFARAFESASSPSPDPARHIWARK